MLNDYCQSRLNLQILNLKPEIDMIGHHFKKFDPNEGGKSRFEQLLDMFMQLLTYTNGDVGEALRWMNELDKKYELNR